MSKKLRERPKDETIPGRNKARGAGKHILVLEDDEGVLELIRKGLKKCDKGHRLTIAGTLESARRIIHDDPPDLAFAAYTLPDGHGDKLLLDGSFAGKFPIIIMTSREDERRAVRILEEGATDYIIKSPAVFDDLPHIARRALRHWHILQERKRAEDALRESETKYWDVVDTLTDGIWVIDKDAATTFVNPKMARILGYTVEEMTGRSLFSFMDDEGRRICEHIIECKSREIKEPHDFELLKKDGTRIFVSIKTNSTRGIDGEYRGMIASVTDITERRMVAEALRTSDEKFRQLFTRMPSAVAVYDAVDGGEDFIFKDFNIAAEKIEGIKKDDLIGKRVTQVFPGVKDFGFFAVVHRVWRTGQPEFFPSAIFRDEHDPGTWRESWVYKLESGEVVVIYHNITERKLAEEKQKEIEDRYRTLAESSLDNIFIIGRDDTIHFVNRHAAETLQIPVDEIIGKSWRTFFSPDIADAQGENLQMVFETGEPLRTEHPARYSNQVIWQDNSLIPLKDKKGKVTSVLGISRDITERKKTEEALREIRERLAFALRSAKAGTWNWDFPTGKLEWSSEFYELFGLPSDSPPSLDTWLAVLHPDDRIPAMEKINQAVQKHKDLWNEYRILLPGERVVWIGSSGRTSYSDTGEPLRMSGICLDITDRKRSEIELKKIREYQEEIIRERTTELDKSRKAALNLMEDAILLREQMENALRESKRLGEELKISLGEKEVLLKEIHHRVKNNLQIIASLLNLQSQYIKDEQTLSVIKDSQNRIKTMALIHEKIYQSESLDRINYGDYLEKITRSLFESYGISPKKIAMKIHAKDIVLHIDKAIPCSLVINELLSNSFKHAFPKDRTGEVQIDVQLDGDTIRLLYSDNGVGLPESVTLDRTESLGMRLIAGLTQQLKGTVEIQRGGGTTFVIAFKV